MWRSLSIQIEDAKYSMYSLFRHKKNYITETRGGLESQTETEQPTHKDFYEKIVQFYLMNKQLHYEPEDCGKS